MDLFGFFFFLSILFKNLFKNKENFLSLFPICDNSRYFCFHCRRSWVSCFFFNKHMFSHCISSNICVARVNIMLTLIPLNGVYALFDVVIINPTQTIGFMSCHFLKNGHNDDGPRKGWAIPWLSLQKSICPSWHPGIWVFH
jgi:hypothetical protein